MEAKKKLASLSSQEQKIKDKDLSLNLRNCLKDFSIHGAIGGFAPIPGEPHWECELMDLDTPLAFPAFENDKMKFYLAKWDELVWGDDFGVKLKVPANKKEEIIPELLLVPGLLFTKKGERLGRGKGFYDRYLSKYEGQKWGLCFAEQIVEQIPREEHDQKVHKIITDRGIIKSED